MRISDVFKRPKTWPDSEDVRMKMRDSVKSTIHSARKCLEHEDFKRYKIEYAKAYDELLKDLLSYNESDPIKYAFHMKQLQIELQMVINLMTKVLRDATRSEPSVPKSEDKNA